MRPVYISKVLIALSTLAGSSAYSQVTVPAVSLQGSADGRIPKSANEAAFHVAIIEARAVGTKAGNDRDSLESALRADASAWVQRLSGTAASTQGIQLDSYGKLRLTAGEEDLAKQTISKRLLASGLSVADRAYTLVNAAVAFANSSKIEQAELYLARLDELGNGAAAQQFRGHKEMAGVYYALGRPKDVLRHALQAVRVLPEMEFPDRTAMYWDAPFYSQVIDILTTDPDAPKRIAALNNALKEAAIPSAYLVAQDSNFYYTGLQYTTLLNQMITVGSRLGTKAQDIVGNYWVNLPEVGGVGGPQTISLSDGKIHILEMGHYTCPQCRTAMLALEKIKNQYPDIQVLSATATLGSWGNRNISSEEEAKHLTEFYRDKLGITFPISIWKGDLKATDDGGMLPENYGPNFENYPLADKPNIYVIDGSGIIRRLFVGSMTPEREKQLVKLIEFLQKEEK